MNQKSGRKLLGVVLMLALVLGMIPGMSLTAYAAANILPGQTWGIGSYIVLNGSMIVYHNGYDTATVSGVRRVQLKQPTYKNGRWEFTNLFETNKSLSLEAQSANDNVKGIKCISGTGVANSPYKFALVFGPTVTLNKDSITLSVSGNTKSLKATVTPDNVVDKTVKWSVGGTDASAVKLYTDSACTSEVGADATDKLTVYAKGISAGTATITVTSNADSTMSANCAVTVNADTPDSIPYMDWNDTAKKLVEMTGADACTDYTAVSNSTTTWGTADETTWYVVNIPSAVTISDRITVRGDVHLILCDGAKLTASKGITVAAGNSLTIYGQVNGIGQLKSTYNAGGASAIGSSDVDSDFGGTVTINGGKVTANGKYAFSITRVIINGGVINATGSATAISSDHVIINNGKVTAVGGTTGETAGIFANDELTINGGDVTGSGSVCGITSYGTFDINDSLTVLAGDSESTSQEVAGFTDDYNSLGYPWAHVFNQSSAHTHSFTYSASGAIITATCDVEYCPLDDGSGKHTATLTIVAPTDLTYDGNAKPVSISDKAGIKGEKAEKYYQANEDGTRGTALDPIGNAPTDSGKYWAEITLGPGKDNKTATAHVVYTIAKATADKPSENVARNKSGINYVAETATPEDGYEISIDGTTVALLPASLTEILNGTGEQKIYLRAAGDVNHDPSDWVAVTLVSRPDAPTGLTTTNATDGDTADGKINGTTADMEYKLKDSTGDWTAASATETTVKPGSYLVRTKATAGAPAGKATEVTVGDDLADAKSTAKTALESYRNSIDDSLYDEDGVAALDAAKAVGDTAIDNASDEDAVTAALENAKTAIGTVKTKEQKDTEAADAVIGKINALPTSDQVTVNDKDDIEATRAAYDALTDAQRAKISEETLNKLTDAEGALAVAEVNEMITALPASDQVTVQDQDAIEAAKSAFDALTDAQKAQVDQALKDKLTADVEALKTAIDQAEADKVASLINALPDPDKVTVDDREAIDAARAAYEALNDTQKAKVSDEAKKKLAEAEKALDTIDQAEADKVTSLINALPDPESVTTEDRKAIEAARAAYEALNDVQKGKVSDNAKKKLADAEKALDAIDQAEADKVTSLINALPAAADVKTTDKDAIKAARAAYNALTDDQKGKVPADTLKKLTDAEDAFVILQAMSEVSGKTGSEMSYTGNPIQLINTPTTQLPAGYTMVYAVTSENQAPTDVSAYSTDVPTAANAGTYYVWYMAQGDTNHNSFAPAGTAVTIEKAAPAVTAPTAKTGLIYSGEAQELINAGFATGGEMQYAVGAVPSNWSTAIPTGTAPGNYFVWYQVVGDANHKDKEAVCIPATIGENLSFIPTLVIEYKHVNGAKAAETYENKIAPGAAYTVLSPEIPGFVPDKAEVSGTMGNVNVSVTVTYSPDTAPKIDISTATVGEIKDQARTGKVIKPKVSVKVNGKALVLNTDYTVAYANNKKIGTASITITGKGSYTGTKKVSFRIIPKKMKISSLKAGKNILTVKWKKGIGIDGYEIQYSLKKNFKGAKKITIKKAKKTSYVIKKLKAGRKYYVRIRAYKKVKGKKYYSEWSRIRSRKVK